MLFKLSLKNIKKSVKDYSLYFFTLLFAVAMFYMFNSIDAQSSMLVLNSSKYDIIEALVQLISYVSIFVSVVLGFLIVYSNNFLIKKRKKEIGLYQILGMSKRKVSLILFLETVFVGAISLVVGLIIGIFLSQFLSVFVSKLFEVNMLNFKFVFSKLAFNKTILYFGIIFIFVIIFNVITLNRYKLIDLINAEKKNEQIKLKNKYITIISFILSIVLLGYAYYLLIYGNVLVMINSKIIVMLVCGSIGTFLLFYSMSGFLLKVFEHIKPIYYKNLNLFTLKQVNNKINTTVISTTVICLMLLLTIGMLSGSMSLARIFNSGLKENNLTDFTIKVFPYYSEKNSELKAEVNDKFNNISSNKEFKNYIKEYVVFHKYISSELKTKDLINEKDIQKLIKEYGTNMSFEYNVPIIKISEYNKFMNLINKDTIDINKNEYLLVANIDLVKNSFKAFYESKKTIKINDIELTPGTKHIINQGYENSTTAGNDGLIVINDELVNELLLNDVSLVGNFIGNDKEKVGSNFNNFLVKNMNPVPFDLRTKIDMEASSVGLKTMVIFLGLYLGITFAISSATVLAIGQLSESSDNKKRYKILGQIGADDKMINKALFTQIAITFIFPLIVALVHSYFGLREINSLLISIGNIDLTSNIMLTTLFMLIVYGGYFLLTYICSKNIIKSK